MFHLSVLNDEAFQKNSKGCRSAGNLFFCYLISKKDKHLEDKKYTETMSNFPFDVNAAKQFIDTQSKKPEPTPDGKTKEETKEDTEFYHHKVSSTDTLVGVALKYNISVNIFSNN